MSGPTMSPVPGPAGFMSGISISPTVVIAGVFAFLFIVDRLMTPSLDGCEPPILKPSLPWIGHIPDIFRKQGDYHRILSKKHGVPAASLQILWGKMYAIWDPNLAQAAIRSSSLSVDPFLMDFARMASGNDEDAMSKLLKPGLVSESLGAMHSSLGSAYVPQMNKNVLEYISRSLSSIGGIGLEQPNMYLWMRKLITRASCHALLGTENPVEKDPSLIDDMWEYEAKSALLVASPFPSITVRSGYKAMIRLQNAFGDFFTAEHDRNDPDVSEFIRRKANVGRKFGLSGRQVAYFDFTSAVAAITNTAPSIYWMMCCIFSRTDLSERLREEVLAQVERRGHEAILDMNRFEAECPLLVSCYREMLRLYTNFVFNRKTTEDLTISDGKGYSCLLKKGVMVQIATAIAHHTEEVWGGNVDDFDPERFLPTDAKSEAEKTRKKSYFPFGGGRHLCPGRQFAFVETMGLTAALMIGFEVTPIGKGWDGVKPELAPFGSVLKPEGDGEGQGVIVKKRTGWENVTWRFVT